MDGEEGHTINDDFRLMGLPRDDEEDLEECRLEVLGASQDAPVDLAADDGEGDGANAGEDGAAGTGSQTASTCAGTWERPSTSYVWDDFTKIFKVINGKRVRFWEYSPEVARTELCHLISRLDLPICIGESSAFEEYIKKAHNPRFATISRQTTTKDITKYFTGHRDKLIELLKSNVSSVAITSNVWNSNAKEDFVSVVTHFVNPAWELEKRVIGFRLIDVSHSGDNIAERIYAVLSEFSLIDKTFSITFDNASANANAMILADRRRWLISAMVERLTCIMDWEEGDARAQHSVEDKDLEAAFAEPYLGEDAIPEAGAEAVANAAT
ncbi:hypothetical protein U9M48_007876 [Paspalum notatum var. saurae]|uniref:Uncharacterized protein n=1 Tax=Paspalum notatum var. saurae TaxID=547442 RepID=A0AAQ3SNE4_PASNO